MSASGNGVGVWAYLAEYERDRTEILAAVDRVFSSGRLVLGESVRGFEDEFAAYNGVEHCVGVDNGTNAVKLALQAVGVRPGDEVITVSNTAAPTAVAIDEIGAVPVFADVREDTYLMDIDTVEDLITPRTRCVLPVHLYGQCVDIPRLREITGTLPVVEDCAQAHGATGPGGRAGAMGEAAAFSFYPTKVLGAYGDGGAVTTSDAGTARTLRRLRYYGMEERYYVEETPGHNARLDEVQAEILRVKLRRLDEDIAARRRIAERYHDGLGDTGLTLPAIGTGNDHVYYLFVARHPRRDELLKLLADQGIHLNVSYPWPIHTMRGFDKLGYRAGDLPVTEKLADEVFSLPMYATLTREDQDRTIAAVRDVLAVIA
ncbi:DegT/DnrJ/EryC1/StrS family aminotransferase [Myceligenerans salitolerans]|uniref:DegT/DnrJ/EryC1/StrS family aminotransferase n=1 Tax=Myceligenerans salitolerans TaxID=1230528 RepID=A0ABS3IDT8_9MICO|nr:DegT/DnrJ/EryC1/StrS family aminotransferase [Myceligenerans salitolerans]MBO0611211.1 DegT/DnrJ/EryC1/StrS family aminotransferase [Myceligenerans salitolerans]